MLTCQKLFVSLDGAATGDGKVSVDVPADGDIEAINWIITGVDASVVAARLELSLSSASGFSTNDTRSALDQVAVANSAAAAAIAINKTTYFDGNAISVAGGDRLFIHLNNDTAGSFDTLRVSCFVYTRVKGNGGGRTRRL